jgi:hypothetical protein
VITSAVRSRFIRVSAVLALVVSSSVLAASATAEAATPLFLISPTSFDFGAQPLNTSSKQQVVTITNASGAPIVMSGAGGGAGIFGGSQDCQGLTIADGASCHMYYQFTPTALGAVTGSTGGNWNGQTFSFHFTGVGTPRFSISPTSFDFGDVTVGTTSPQQVVTITNLGSTAITMSGAGGGAGQFGGSQDCQGLSIAAHKSCHMYYQFHPTAVGAATGSTGGNWNGQTFAFTFTGNATPPLTGDFVPLRPTRVLDTRNGTGYFGAKPTAGQTIMLFMGPVPVDAAAADLTVIATSESANGSVRVWACGAPKPTGPSLTFRKAVTISTHVNAALGTSGSVCLQPSAGTHLVADLDGYYPSTSNYHPTTSPRLLDTRNHTGYTGSKPTAGKTIQLKVTGGSVPSNAAAVALDVTATQEAASGGLTVWPCGGSAPLSQALSYHTGHSVVLLVVSKVGSGGKVCIRTSKASHVVADLRGWYAGGASFTAVRPQRLVDTRNHTGSTGGKPAAGHTTIVKITGVGAANIPSGARAVVLDVTATQEAGLGQLTLYACGSAVPLTALVDYVTNATITNLAVAKIGTSGRVCLRTSASAHLVVDLVGWYGA